MSPADWAVLGSVPIALMFGWAFGKIQYEVVGCQHKWEKWTTLVRETMSDCDNLCTCTCTRTRPYDFQRRTCTACGQTDEREVVSE